MAEGGKEAYEAVKNEYMKTTSIDGKEICLQALGRVQTTELINDFLDFQFSNEVKVQDMHSGSVALAANPKARDALWQYIKDHWDMVHGKLSGNAVVLGKQLSEQLSPKVHRLRRFEICDLSSYAMGNCSLCNLPRSLPQEQSAEVCLSRERERHHRLLQRQGHQRI